MISSRYTTIKVLGRGRSGEVSLVFDALRQQRVAKKRLLNLDAHGILEFKREFRVVEKLIHPGLVRLYELGEEDGKLFFTMEAIEGLDIISYCTSRVEVCTPKPAETNGDASIAHQKTVLWERLKKVLPQVLEALAFLHNHDVVHRDLKPEHILVSSEGAVKLVDFGILGVVGKSTDVHPSNAVLSGTLGYMAPEQLLGEPPVFASDLYALGAILFELISGRPVFSGNMQKLIYQHLNETPPQLGLLSTYAPRPLCAACQDLLRKNPEKRPTISQLAHRVLPALGEKPLSKAMKRPHQAVFVGRDHEKRLLGELLDQAQSRQFKLIALQGPTGVGKTSLALWLTEAATQMGMTALKGQGRPSVKLAFGAIDHCIDMLALELEAQFSSNAPVWLKQTLEIAAAAFPVLALESLSIFPRAAGSRNAVFSAVTALLADIAKQKGGLILLVDDLQWADEDSLAFLDHLTFVAPKSMLIATTIRDDVEPTPASLWLDGCKDKIQLKLPSLDDAAICEILENRMSILGAPPPDPELLQKSVQSCAGHPYLAELAGQALAGVYPKAQSGLIEDVLCTLLGSASEIGRELILFLVVFEQWVDIHWLSTWMQKTLGEILDLITILEHDLWIRVSRADDGSQQVSLYHHAVHEAALKVMAPETLCKAHDCIARSLAQNPSRHIFQLVRHCLGAGQSEKAAFFAVEAGEQATAKRAYALAAEMYKVALTYPGEKALFLLRQRAHALEKGGHYAQAAECWRDVAQRTADDAEKIDAAMHEAHTRLAAFDLQGGRRCLEHALIAVQEPLPGQGSLANLWAGIRFVLGPRRVTSSKRNFDSAQEPRIREQANRDIRLGQLVSYFDVFSGIRYLQRAQKSLLKVGTLEQAAWCDYTFAYISLLASRKCKPVPLAKRYMKRAASRLQGQAICSLEVRTFPVLLHGVAAQREGRWAEARKYLDQGIAELEQEGVHGTFEHLLALVHRAQIDLFSEDFLHYTGSLTKLVEASHQVGDSAVRCHVVCCQAAQHFYQGRFQTAREMLDALINEWDESAATYQRFISEIFRALIQIYLTDSQKERRRLAKSLERNCELKPMSSMYAGLMGSVLALVEVSALRSGDKQASARRCRAFVARAAGAPPFGICIAWRAMAYLEDAAGHKARALQYLVRAEKEAQRFDLSLDLAITHYQRGKRLGGKHGQELIEKAESTLLKLGVHRAILDEDVALR